MARSVWPNGIVGSISHSQGLAVALAAPDRIWTGIGADIEHFLDPHAEEAVQTDLIDAREAAVLEGSGLPMRIASTVAFAAKESFFKGCFPAVGAFFGFEIVRIADLQRQPAIIELVLQNDLSPDLGKGRRFNLRCLLVRQRAALCAFAWRDGRSHTPPLLVTEWGAVMRHPPYIR